MNLIDVLTFKNHIIVFINGEIAFKFKSNMNDEVSLAELIVTKSFLKGIIGF